MDPLDTLADLSGQMELEHAEESHGQGDPVSNQDPARPGCYTPKEKRATFTSPAQMPGGKQFILLKALLTSACERDCYSCPFRGGRDFRRATFKPQEFADLFAKLNQAKIAEGIFLSSGIAAGGVKTQDRLL